MRVFVLILLLIPLAVPSGASVGVGECVADACVVAAAGAGVSCQLFGQGGASAVVILHHPTLGWWIVQGGATCARGDFGWGPFEATSIGGSVWGSETPVDELRLGAQWWTASFGGMGGCDTWAYQETRSTPYSERHFGCPLGPPILP